MIINISDILQHKTDSIPFGFIDNSDKIKRENTNIELKSPIIVRGEVHYDGEIVEVTGSVKTSINAICSRCLKNFEYFIDVEFEEEYSENQGDEEYYPIKHNEINLKDMVIDNIMLSIPLKMLCDEDCKGLCPKCGCNLNDESCSCTRDDVDPRLAVLKDLFKGD